MNCEKCGEPNPTQAAFCLSCGQALTASAADRAKPAVRPFPIKSRWVFFGLGGLLLAGCLLLIVAITTGAALSVASRPLATPPRFAFTPVAANLATAVPLATLAGAATTVPIRASLGTPVPTTAPRVLPAPRPAVAWRRYVPRDASFNIEMPREWIVVREDESDLSRVFTVAPSYDADGVTAFLVVARAQLMGLKDGPAVIDFLVDELKKRTKDFTVVSRSCEDVGETVDSTQHLGQTCVYSATYTSQIGDRAKTEGSIKATGLWEWNVTELTGWTRDAKIDEFNDYLPIFDHMSKSLEFTPKS